MFRSLRIFLFVVFATCLGVVLAAASPPRAPALALEPAAPAADNCWTGSWEQTPRFGLMWLVQDGATVSGSYEWDWGRLSGRLDGNVLRGEWAEWPTYAPPSDAGSFAFTILPDCASFEGIYNYGDENDWQTWTGTRVDAPGSIGLQVDEPSVTYAGQVYEPGQTFFPEACETKGAAVPGDTCEATISLESEIQRLIRARTLATCVYSKIKNVLAIVEQAKLEPDEEALVIAIALAKGYEKCAFGPTRTTAQLDLKLYQGVGLISNAAAGQVLNIDAQVATVTSSGAGSFLAGYHPETGEAVFAAHGAPLTITPVGGMPIILPPYHQVELTADGPGPIKELTTLLLPAVVAP